MRKGLLTAVVLAGGLVFSTVGCFNNGGKKQDNHEYTVSIDNKEELQAEWLSDGQGRSLSLTITKDGVEQNATKAINDGELTFTVADNEVVRVRGRVVTPVGAGTTTVTATYGKATDSVEVTITASNPHGKSEDDPLNVAEAIAVCKETGTTATSIDYYIRGIVVNAEAYSEQHGNITFNMGDTIDSTAVVKVFRAKPIENPPYDPTKISKGSEVLVKGKLVNYNGKTPELDSGGSILTATAGQQAQTIQATVAEALAAAKALGENITSDDKYEITGYITSVVPGSGFYMSDTKGAVDPSQEQFLVYYGSSTMPEDATVNAKVKVLDKIKHYVSTSTAGKYAYETASTGPEEYECLEPGDAPAETVEATVTEALAVIAELANGATTTTKYKVTGYVISPEVYNTQFSNITFNMGDTADAAADAQLKAFRVSTTKEIGDRIIAGARLSVEGFLQKYVKDEAVTPELVSGNEATIISDPAVPELTGIELTPATLSADVLNGEVKKQLTVSPVPERAELGTVTYTVDPADAGVTVSSTGEVTVAQTAVEDDQTKTFTITATCGDFSDTATLTVTKDTAGGGEAEKSWQKVTEAPVDGSEYKLALDREDNATNPGYWYLKDAMDGFYVTTSADVNEGADVTVAAVQGGYTVKLNNKYLSITNGDSGVNVGLADDPVTLEFNDDLDIFGITVSGKFWGLGTRNDRTFTTAGRVDFTSYPNNYKVFLMEYKEVPAAPELEGISVSPKTIDIDIAKDQLTKQLEVAPSPAGAVLGDVTWDVTPSEAGVTVENGLVTVSDTAVEEGGEDKVFTIVAQCGDFEDTATLTVSHSAAPQPGDEVTVTKTAAELQVENEWGICAGTSDMSANIFNSFDLDENITVSFTGIGNTATYWSSGTQIRVYCTKEQSDASITIAGKEGVTIVSVTLTFALKNSPTFPLTSGTADSVNANSKTYTVTGGEKNGQVQITAFSVTYTVA